MFQSPLWVRMVAHSHLLQKTQTERRKVSQSNRPRFLQDLFPRRCYAKLGIKARSHSLSPLRPEVRGPCLGELHAQCRQGFPVESADHLTPSKIPNGGGMIYLVTKLYHTGLFGLQTCQSPSSEGARNKELAQGTQPLVTVAWKGGRIHLNPEIL